MLIGTTGVCVGYLPSGRPFLVRVVSSLYGLPFTPLVIANDCPQNRLVGVLELLIFVLRISKERS